MLCYFDLETVARPAAIPLLADPQANKSLKDPDKIIADLERKRAAQLVDLSLDPYGARIVALAWQIDTVSHVGLCFDEAHERTILEHFWRCTATCDLVGFNVRRFDLPVIIARSRLLQVPFPFHMGAPKWLKYGSSIIDLYELVTFGQGYGESHPISRGLLSMCRVHGVDIPEDDATGSEIAALVAAEDWVSVQQHVTRDLTRTKVLAERLGVVPRPLDEADEQQAWESTR